MHGGSVPVWTRCERDSRVQGSHQLKELSRNLAPGALAEESTGRIKRDSSRPEVGLRLVLLRCSSCSAAKKMHFSPEYPHEHGMDGKHADVLSPVRQCVVFLNV